MTKEHCKKLFPDQTPCHYIERGHYIQLQEMVANRQKKVVAAAHPLTIKDQALPFRLPPSAVNPYAGLSNSVPTVHANMAMNNQGQMVPNVYVSNNPIARNWALTSPTNA